MTAYTTSGRLLEQHQPLDASTSYIWGYHELYPIAEVKNAAPGEIAYTSFEEEGKGNWSYAGTPVQSANAYTGGFLYNLSAATPLSKSGLNPATVYKCSFWVQASSSVTIAGTTSTTSGSTRNGWTYYEKLITGVTTVTLTGSGNLDEVRLYPQKALMSSYTYETMIGITSQTDVKNATTFYEYDGLGRLSLIRDQDRNILKKLCYNYFGQPENCGQDMTPNWQPTGVTRCKPCPANAAYNSTIQQVQKIDINSNSSTYNTQQWFDNGVSSSCLAPADYQVINTYCEIVGGVYTGNQITVRQDMNPCSSTSGSTTTTSLQNCATCPKPANWQPTGNLRCLLASGVNTGIQEREEKNMEACSTNPNALRWTVVGTNCTTCPKPANWQPTGNYRCVLNGTDNSGVQEREEKDMESCSPSANTLRWVSNGTNTSACPITVYAKIFVIDKYNDAQGSSATIVVRFFSNAACTVATSVTNLTVNYKRVRTNCNGTSPLTGNFSIVCNGTQTSIGTEIVNTNDGIHCWNYVFSVTAGTGYVAK
jgi:YD repeat-containing protein